MKISFDFKCHKEDYIKELEQKGFDVDTNTSFGNVWVYDLNVVSYLDLTDRDGFKIKIENKTNFNDVEIYLEDLEHFEVHS